MKDMSTNTLRYSPEEFASKGTQIYQEQILPKLGKYFDGKIVAIDIETGEFELADTTLAAAAKMFASEMCGRVADRCVQIHGGAGYLAEYEAERFFRDARIYRIYEGTTQILQLVIAKNMLREFGAGV